MENFLLNVVINVTETAQVIATRCGKQMLDNAAIIRIATDFVKHNPMEASDNEDELTDIVYSECITDIREAFHMTMQEYMKGGEKNE